MLGMRVVGCLFSNAILGICRGSDTCSPRPIFSTAPISRLHPPLLLHQQLHSPMHYCAQTAHCTLHTAHCGLAESEYSTVLNCLPSPAHPQPPNFCQLCPLSLLHCRAQGGAGILIKGYTPSFSPPFTPLPNRKPDSAALSGR